jgi:hypothetical protein
VKVYTPNVINVAVMAGVYGSGEVAQTREGMFGSLEEAWSNLREAFTTQGWSRYRGPQSGFFVCCNPAHTNT